MYTFNDCWLISGLLFKTSEDFGRVLQKFVTTMKLYLLNFEYGLIEMGTLLGRLTQIGSNWGEFEGIFHLKFYIYITDANLHLLNIPIANDRATTLIGPNG